MDTFSLIGSDDKHRPLDTGKLSIDSWHGFFLINIKPSEPKCYRLVGLFGQILV
jgi:hypothetical protein